VKAVSRNPIRVCTPPNFAECCLDVALKDALAIGTEALIDLAKSLPGTQVLDEPVQSTGVVVTVPKNQPATRDWAVRLVETQKRTARCAGPSTAPASLALQWSRRKNKWSPDFARVSLLIPVYSEEIGCLPLDSWCAPKRHG
jgi:hypothetical protein